MKSENDKERARLSRELAQENGDNDNTVDKILKEKRLRELNREKREQLINKTIIKK